MKGLEESFMRTFLGHRFDPSNPESLVIDIGDIAHALSRVNRYNGHLAVPLYSVSQHSVLVHHEALRRLRIDAKELSRVRIASFRLQALLHDATEAYLPDMPKPIKVTLPDFIALEDRLQRHIFKHFGLPEEIRPLIKQVDKEIRVNEVLSMQNWDIGVAKDSVELIEPWDYIKAEREFLKLYAEINHET